MPAPWTDEQVVQNIMARSVNDAITGCVLWQGSRTPKGYGMVCRSGKGFSVHRVVYRFVHGDIPEGMLVMHVCDVPNCVNPNHLKLGTNDENMMDKCLKGRSGKKLTIERVKEMRRLYAAGLSQTMLSRIFGVNQPSVSRALHGVRWGHVPGGVLRHSAS